MERRYITKEFRVESQGDGTTKVVGYASVFNKPSEDLGGWTEDIDPKAFDSVLKSDPDVRALWNHNPDHVLGRTKAGTLSLSTDKEGLRYEITMPDTQCAIDLVKSMKRGDVTGSSFGFTVASDKWDKDEAHRTILDIDSLLDVSPVTYPAYPDASSAVERSLPASMPKELRSKIAAKRASEEARTKRVDGEDLTADDFLLVGDPDKTETWALPWKFSTESKTISHLRNALARFDQVKGFSKDELDKAWNKLVNLCKAHDIDVSEDKRDDEDEIDEGDDGDCTDDTDDTDEEMSADMCKCSCEQCKAGACSICSNDDCDEQMCGCYNQRSLMQISLSRAKYKYQDSK